MINIMWSIPWIVLLIFLFVYPFKEIIRISNIKSEALNYQDKSSIFYFFRNREILEIVHYIFLLRVPIISGLFLFSLPIISQWVYPRFLRNIFVMESGIQLMLVIAFTFITAMIIISLIISIFILTDKSKIPYGLSFILTRLTWTFVLCLPTWIVLFLNKEPNIKWYYFLLGIILILFLLLFDVTNEYIKLKNIEGSKKIAENRLFQGVRKVQIYLDNQIGLFLGFEVIVGAIFYLLAIYLNYPQADGKIKIPTNWQAPTLLYALLIIWVVTLLLGAIIYVFDKYADKDDEKQDSSSSKYRFHWPVILLLIIFSACGYGAFQVDHYFQLKESSVEISESNYQKDFFTAIGNRLCPENFAKDKSCNQEQSLVVVAASGGGIQASGWTAQVLAGLQDKTLGIGEDFTKAIALISSTSGGSVGTMFYLDKFNDRGILSKDGLEKVVKNATDDWLDSVGWGLAYPDLVRAIGFPFVNVNQYLDRGYALEKDWQRTLTPSTTTLDDWYKKAKLGEIPIPVFNSTLVENGRRFLISPMKFIPGQMRDYLDDFSESELSEEDQQKIKQSRALDFRTLYNCGTPEAPKICNLDVMTAARLSATFPYVSPMARNDKDNQIQNPKTGKPTLQNYHMADGGYFDNSGEFTAIQWLDKFLEDNAAALKIKKVVLLQINAFPEEPLKTEQKGRKGFLTVLLGPLDALNGVRNSTQIDRNIQAVELLKDYWHEKRIMIQRVNISFPKEDPNGTEYDQPLSWHLTQQQKNNLKNAWENDETIRKTVDCLKTFWNNGQTNDRECPNLS